MLHQRSVRVAKQYHIASKITGLLADLDNVPDVKLPTLFTAKISRLHSGDDVFSRQRMLSESDHLIVITGINYFLIFVHDPSLKPVQQNARAVCAALAAQLSVMRYQLMRKPFLNVHKKRIPSAASPSNKTTPMIPRDQSSQTGIVIVIFFPFTAMRLKESTAGRDFRFPE
jgi:hypothetical protein